MRYSGVCTTMWAVFPSASTVVLPTLGRPAGDEQKALPGALSPLGGTLVTLTIPDILEERCTTRQALERLASKRRGPTIFPLGGGGASAPVRWTPGPGPKEQGVTQKLPDQGEDRACVPRGILNTTA